MKIAICDDDTVFQRELKQRLTTIDFFKDSIFLCFQNGKELVEKCDLDSPYDFVFLDVDMPEMNGLEAGEKLNKLSSRTIIVFVSSFPQFALDAFDCNAVGYLLKGCDEKRFSKTMERAIEKYKITHSQICLKTGIGIITLFASEILYVEYVSKYCKYHTSSAVYSVRRPLQEALLELSPLGFVQIYQCFVVNMDKIKKIQSAIVLLTSGLELPIKRGSSKELIREYTRFINRRF